MRLGWTYSLTIYINKVYAFNVMGICDEICNALTMPPPPLVLYAFLVHNPANLQLLLITIAVAAQVPFSISYHLREATRGLFGQQGDRIDNHWRRVDQTTQHLSQLAITFAISASTLYTLASVPLHAIGLLQLWQQETTNDGHRWRPIAVGVVVYCAPMLGASPLHFFEAMLPMIIGALCAFVPGFKFEGGHAVMHAMACVHATALAHYLTSLSS